MPRRHFEDEPADVRTLRAMVNMPLVTVLAVRTVRLDARQAHGAAGAVRAFPMIEIRRHGDALSLITLPPLMVNASRDASFLIKAHDRRKTLRIFVVAQTSKRFRGMAGPDTDNSAPASSCEPGVSRPTRPSVNFEGL